LKVEHFEEYCEKPHDINEHLSLLYFLVVSHNLKTVLELGTDIGFSTRALLCGVKRTGGYLTSIDIKNCPEIKQWISDKQLDKYWTFVESNDLFYNLEKPIDLLFVDSMHTHDQLKAELNLFSPKTRKFIAIHDTNHAKYGNALNAAIDDFLKDSIWEEFHFYHNFGMTVLWKKKL